MANLDKARHVNIKLFEHLPSELGHGAQKEQIHLLGALPLMTQLCQALDQRRRHHIKGQWRHVLECLNDWLDEVVVHLYLGQKRVKHEGWVGMSHLANLSAVLFHVLFGDALNDEAAT